jgi:asparagine synthase (glutamine-hydrolysing)
MTEVLLHRGPDDEGYFAGPGVSLGHRRLSIIDIAGGHQPVANEDGRIQLVYNGEIYNFRELRRELQELGHRFASECDSEVVVHAYEQWGCDCFRRFNGMWAVALADLDAGRLVLSRDHFGIKPLYYARSGERWLFGSEIKALLQDPALCTAPNDQMIYEYLARGLHDHRPETFFEGILRVPAAAYAVIDADGIRIEPYWRPVLDRTGGLTPAQFHTLFRTAVARRLVSDVPVGACLSGGLDSSAIVSELSALLGERNADAESLQGRVQTFSAVFDGDPIDERAYIEEEVGASGSSSRYVHPDSREFLRELTDMVWYQEEPMVSTGPYAQWCVLREASHHVRVLLDGQGGDELLAGYVPYHAVYLRQLLRERRWGAFVREAWAARDVLLPLWRQRRGGRRGATPDPRRLLRPEFVSSVQAPVDTRPADNLKARLLQDLTVYSLPALLRYEDRNSMAHSVESRVPWLDPEVVEAILRLPDAAIIHQGWNRAIFRAAMEGTLPEKIRGRRWKVGFTTPESRWIFARRAAWQSLFRSPLFCSRKYWDGPAIAAAFRECARRRGGTVFFWRVINVELWLRVFFPAGAQGRPVRRPEVDFTRLGDAAAAAEQTPGDLDGFAANSGRHLFALYHGAIWMRAPLHTRLVESGDDLAALVREATGDRMEPGDVVVVTERIVAISQGRSFPREQVQPRPLARVLTRFVHKTPSGIGLGVPETMELALRQAGVPRVVLAAAVAAVARPFGVRGIFYRITGPAVAAIDGPTRGTIPPYCDHVKLGPENPQGVAERLRQSLGASVEVAIVDANDIGVNVLGHTAGIDPTVLAELLADNPKAQGSEQTPIVLLRRLRPHPAPAVAAGATEG